MIKTRKIDVRSATLRVLLTMTAAAAIALFALGDALAQSKPNIRISTGRQGGAYYNMGAVLADALYRSGKVASATAESASGGIENMRLLDKGTVQLGATDKVWVARAVGGEKPFTKKIDLRTVAPLGVWQLFFVTRADSAIKRLEDLKGKRLAVGAKGSGMENHSKLILAALGWTFKDIKPVYLSFRPGSRAVKDGKADAQLQCCVPNPAMTELSELSKVRAVSLDTAIDKIVTNPVYGKATLPKGAFRGHDKDMVAIADVNGWMAHKGLPDDVAYLVAKTLIENVDAFAKKMPQFASIKPLFERAKTEGASALEVAAPLHPGAVRAFKEAGILK